MYVIQRDDGKFVCLPGGLHSYTVLLQNALGFPTREAAESYGICTRNEKVVSVDDLIRKEK